jgi:ABC-type branched-subunit amino acid transport system permease subunit
VTVYSDLIVTNGESNNISVLLGNGMAVQSSKSALEYLLHTVVMVGIYTVLAVSLDLLVGQTGLGGG